MPCEDTLLLHHALHPGMTGRETETQLKSGRRGGAGHNLGFVAAQYLDVEPWKHLGGEGAETLDDLRFYNALDARHTLEAFYAMQAQDEACQTNREFYELLKEVTPIASAMTLKGLPIDKAALREFGVQTEKEMHDALEGLRQKHSWPEFNPNSTNHMRELLFQRLQLSVVSYTKKTHALSTDKGTLVQHMEHDDVRAVMTWKALRKLRSDYVIPLLAMDSPRLHATWNSHGAATARWSSSPNVQNWTKAKVEKRCPNCTPGKPCNAHLGMRRIVVAPKGRMFVAADFAQLELRLLAVYAKVAKLIQAFQRGDDVHALIAADLFAEEWPTAEAPVRKALRDVAKRFEYGGLAYMGTADTIYHNLRPDYPELSRSRIEVLLLTLFARYPEIKEFHHTLLHHVKQEHSLTVVGWTRRFWTSEVDATVIANWPIQTTAAILMNKAIVRVARAIRGRGDLLVNGHDSVLVECDRAKAKDVAGRVSKAMTTQFEVDGVWLDLPVDVKVGRSWANV